MNLQDLCERIARDAIPTTDSGATCFVPRYQIDQLREALSAPQPPAEAQAQGGGEVWQHPDTLPPVESGQYGWFWVAVRRTNGRVYSFPATYLNAMVLADENGDQEESRGNRYHHGPVDQDDGTFEATGWHDAKEHSEYSAIYLPLLDSDKDELIAWRSVADYGDTAPPSAPVHGCAEQVHDGNWDSDAAAIGGLHAPSAPVGVEAELLYGIRELLAALPADCLGSDEAADGQPYPIRDEVIDRITKALAQQPAPSARAVVGALEVFRLAGGDTEREPNPTPERALEVLHNLRACYEVIAQQPAAVDGAMVERIVDAIVSDPMNNTDSETLRVCVSAALAQQPGGSQ